VYNPNTGLYVLWWNYVHPNGTYAGFAAATASNPAGPFEQRVASVNITYERADVQAGDLKLFVDDDGAGYGALILVGGLSTPESITLYFKPRVSFRNNMFSELSIEIWHRFFCFFF